MLKILRQKAKYFYFLFFIVIITFVFYFGWDIAREAEPIYVAEVAGKKITKERFWREYEETRRVYKEILKQKENKEMENFIKNKVLEDLINEEVIMWFAQKYKIEATEKEIQDAIVNDPRFKRDGVFQKEIYFQVLKLNRITPAQYESYLKRQITLAKTLQIILSAKDLSIPDDVFLKSFLNGIKSKISIKINRDVLI
ncbi:SurA N-terminal domain-containing protein [Candidatus Caldatribacterium sp.]|uniref:SurA N-terminal domain-containing protein n=1 Tax=Candidatus Caldatribacterium sp. TaxID=2282143 RepID=UPI0038412BFF|nr:SurA N-terminal domain-containing protein [Candidatus Caldatribacterium sp.]